MQEYFYRDKSGNEIGPLALDNLAKFRSAGVLDGDTPVRAAESSEWKPCREIIADTKPTPFAASQTPAPKAENSGAGRYKWVVVVSAALAIVVAIRFGISGTPSVKQGERFVQNRIDGESTTPKSLRERAEGGDANAQYELAKMYAGGQGVDTNIDEAAKWCRKAADLGNVQAETALGELYSTGQGVEKDDAEAARWFQKAAIAGFGPAQIHLGLAYLNALGVKQDCPEAVIWFRKAADQGDARAQLVLGAVYEEGRCVGKDETEALKWYRKAAEAGIDAAKGKLHELDPSVRCESNLKQIGLALAMFADVHDGRLPSTLDELRPKFLATDRVLTDPGTGGRYTYFGAGKLWQENPSEILARCPVHGHTLYNDGHVALGSQP